MEDFIFQVLVTTFLVLMPLVGPKSRGRREQTDYREQSRIHSIYGVNENGKLEILTKDGEEESLT